MRDHPCIVGGRDVLAGLRVTCVARYFFNLVSPIKNTPAVRHCDVVGGLGLAPGQQGLDLIDQEIDLEAVYNERQELATRPLVEVFPVVDEGRVGIQESVDGGEGRTPVRTLRRVFEAPVKGEGE